MSKRLLFFLPFLCMSVIIPSLVFKGNSNKAPDGFVTIEKQALPFSPKVVKKNAKLNWSQKKQKVKGLLPKDSPDKFIEWHRGIRTRDGAGRPDYPANYKIKELLKARRLKSTKDLSLNKSAQTLNWQERGPGNVAGRTRSILIDPNDPNFDTWIVGAVGGGVWETTDAGQTWTELTKELPNLATSTLAWAPDFPNIIYAGTGEGFAHSAVDYVDGAGIWKTDNGGATWNQITSVADNPDFDNVMRMAVDPADPMLLVVAVDPSFYHFGGTGPTSGIYRTTDGGATWTKTFEAGPGTSVEDLRANPKNFKTQYATINGAAVIKSTDGGQTWAQSDQGISFVGANGVTGRMELAISESDTARIYISAQGGNSGSILYSSFDAGATWHPHVNASGRDIDWLAGQGWYDNAIGVNPYNADEVFVGGVNLWKLNASAAIDTSVPQITSIVQENTQPFWAFVNWGGSYAGGGLDLASVWWGIAPLALSEYSSVEIRFGAGKIQKAHRFVRDGATGNYIYMDYSEVNFEVWDIDNNQQLMVSFRDHEDNGAFELEDRATDPDGMDREYLMIHTLAYAAVEDTNIAQDNGMIYQQSYFMWPEAPAGVGETDFSDVTAEAVIRINWETTLTRAVEAVNVTDGYRQFGGNSKGVHVDHHAIVFVKTNENSQSFRLLNGNDGGISYSDDGGKTFKQTGDSFSRGLKGYNTSQFYGVDKMNGAHRYIGGTQDNGTWFSPEDPDETSSWQHAPSGDGFEAAWNYRDPNLMLESSQFGSIYRSTNRGQTWSWIGRLVDSGNGPFITKIASSKQDADLVFVMSARGVWRSDNFGASWTLTEMPSGFDGASHYSQLVISLSNPQIVWAARRMTPESPPSVSTNGGVSFDTTSIYTKVTMSRISGLDTHPTDENTAYVLSSVRGIPKVLRTTDLGQTWEDISGFSADSTSSNGFPDVAVYSFLVMPFDTNILWAGTEIGIFESEDGGGTWAFADNGLSAVAVYEMKIVNDEVVVATHGRGIWTVSLPELSGYEPQAAPLAPRFASISSDGHVISANVILPSAYDSSFILVDDAKSVSLGVNRAWVDTSFEFALFVEDLDTVSVSLAAYAGGNELINVPANLIVIPFRTPLGSFAENFDLGGEEFFVLTGMGIRTPDGFDNAAIHSLHPYPDAANMTALLKAPIVVSITNATLKYDDIAIVEPGTGTGVFGDSQFWDYVIVEGSLDNGSTWLPLADGYDARADSTWLANYPAGAGEPAMYVSHEINLLDTFAASDVILIRFRLFADANTNGWGWAIDNINIQDGVVSVASQDVLPDVFSLSQNYPNPFNPTTQINYALPKDAEVTLQVFNIAGQKVRDIIVGQAQKAGSYTIAWNGRDNQGMQVSSGLYFYRIRAGNFVKTRKMTLLR